IRGAIWYQGESNHGEGMLYTEKTRAQINGWREVFGQPNLPYYFVQIAPYHYGEEDPTVLAKFWEAQSAILEIPRTGMALCHDIGNLNDIHPKNKQDVGKRLGLIALADTYGRDVIYSGPTFREMKIKDGMIRLLFDHVGGGLVSRDGEPLNWFEIIGEDSGWVEADARIAGDAVVLSAPEVKKAAAMRFAWHKLAEPNLMNAAGLPAVQFRAGEVPKRDFLTKVKDAEGYELALDIDLAKLGRDPKYDVDNRGEITGAFDRIAYILELQTEDGAPQFAYVSMDAFTDDLGKIGVPTVASGAVFQMHVTNMNVVSNVESIVTGEGIATGNIEFWPNNYGPPNDNSVPNASGAVWDFGDQYADPVDGYGSMQIGNYGDKQTILAINNWKSAPSGDLGIGNSDGDTRDWTFKNNAASYMSKRLRVLVRLVK
ncbi:MAG TPA: sialate O-acetylesterase, partial [Armatimonadota bacterium]|nr:sialate O-acetylesterase [Armatimonadota bacterium]